MTHPCSDLLQVQVGEKRWDICSYHGSKLKKGSCDINYLIYSSCMHGENGQAEGESPGGLAVLITVYRGLGRLGMLIMGSDPSVLDLAMLWFPSLLLQCLEW